MSADFEPQTFADHAQEALRLREVTFTGVACADPDTAHYAALANMHATLALVEQQRVANLIAVLTAENSDFFLLMPGKAREYGTPFEQMLEKVQRALGFYEDVAS